MESWIKEYRSRVKGTSYVAKLVKSGDKLYTSGNAATPGELLNAIEQLAPEVHDVQLAHVLLLGKPIGSNTPFRHLSFFVGEADRESVNSGESDYIPVFLHQIPSIFDSGRIKFDMAIVQTSPPDDHGFLSLGVEVMASKAAIRNAKIVVAQVNERMPRTHGDSFIHVSEVDHFIELTHELPELPKITVSDATARIGRFVADLIKDGDTLQLGIGAIPDATLANLLDKKDIGVHSEMISDGVIRGIEKGIINNKRKNFKKDVSIATFALGSNLLYRFIDDNPMFNFHPVDFTNDPYTASENDNLVSINSAIEVDLTGQVCADSIGHYIYSGFGGQVDFVRAAARSKGGRSIIALPSTAKAGTMSRIVSQLKPGSGVVTTRADVHYVVTEFGVADLWGKSLKQRAALLIGIADPRFRPMLMEETKKASRLL